MFGMPGTNVYTVMYFFVIVIAAILVIAKWLFPMWRQYGKKMQAAEQKGDAFPSIVGPLVTTLVVAAIFIVASTLAYNAMQGVTTNSSNYQNPTEAAEKKAVEESQMPSTEELDKAREEQKERAQIRPHQQAIENFDNAMEREAEKIRRRSSDSLTTAPIPTRSK